MEGSAACRKQFTIRPSLLECPSQMSRGRTFSERRPTAMPRCWNGKTSPRMNSPKGPYTFDVGTYRGRLKSGPRFLIAVAYQFCLKLLKTFSHPGAHFLAQPCCYGSCSSSLLCKETEHSGIERGIRGLRKKIFAYVLCVRPPYSNRGRHHG